MKNSFQSEACSPQSEKWERAVKRETPLYERGNEIRTEFERDCTRLLHCQAYSRLKRKTQVFFATHNDHVCTRMEHVGHVASVASTIAKNLGLNTQLVTAIAIGHDIGHAPFGHHGEDCLNSLLMRDSPNADVPSAPKKFWHERNSLFFADYIETLADPSAVQRPLNLTYAVRDGLICHCGEIDQQGIRPRNEAIDLYSIKRAGVVQPFTWEGCVVKIADKISFIGRDIEDARAYHILDMSAYRQLREIVASTLGLDPSGKAGGARRSGKAVNTTVLINDLIVDLCEQSSPQNGLCLSEPYFKFLMELRKFNMARIYTHWRLMEFQQYATLVLETIYRALVRALPYAQNGRAAQALRYYPKLCATYEEWLVKYSNYRPRGHEDRKQMMRCDTKETFDVNDPASYQKCAIEYISGMTDQFAIQVYEEIIMF